MSSKLSLLIDKKTIKIVQLVLNRPNEIFHLKKISTETKVPLGSTHRIISKLRKIELLETILVGKIKLYKLNKKNSKEFKILK